MAVDSVDSHSHNIAATKQLEPPILKQEVKKAVHRLSEQKAAEFVDNTDEYTDENIDEGIEEQHYGNRDMILNEEVTMREENIVEECVEHINEETNANIDVNNDEQHFGNQKIILKECTGIFDIVEDSSSSQDERMNKTVPTKYNKKNNQTLRLLGKIRRNENHYK
ncbi:hypothetical protein HHI36_004965 [Cryptolaemus montrouzieri]|uniref:Uncharacterized protein n=1 Tax=Cryptolaemus montrouzieri TaxID=559131 RepID=A0ABD2NSS7_9CUCU